MPSQYSPGVLPVQRNPLDTFVRAFEKTRQLSLREQADRRAQQESEMRAEQHEMDQQTFDREEQTAGREARMDMARIFATPLKEGESRPGEGLARSLMDEAAPSSLPAGMRGRNDISEYQVGDQTYAHSPSYQSMQENVQRMRNEYQQQAMPSNNDPELESVRAMVTAGYFPGVTAEDIDWDNVDPESLKQMLMDRPPQPRAATGGGARALNPETVNNAYDSALRRARTDFESSQNAEWEQYMGREWAGYSD